RYHMDMTSPGSRLRSLMDKGCIAMPGAFNALCGRAIARAGFEACYVSGAATSVCAGVPDVGLLTLEHFVRTIREVADGARKEGGERLPVLADADTGFGEEEMVRGRWSSTPAPGLRGCTSRTRFFPSAAGT